MRALHAQGLCGVGQRAASGVRLLGQHVRATFAVQLLFDPFVRRRPLVFAVTLIAALSCLYIGGEEVSWGQHIFFWQNPDSGGD